MRSQVQSFLTSLLMLCDTLVLDHGSDVTVDFRQG